MELTHGSHVLKRLIDLQELESKVTQIKKRVDETPRDIEKLDEELAAEFGQVQQAEKALQESKSQRKKLEGEVETLRTKLSHYKGQLMEVKTNVSYQAMLHEITFVEQQITAKEDAILEEMMAHEELVASLETANRHHAERRLEIEAKKNELQDFVVLSATEMVTYTEQQQQLESEIPADYLNQYKRISAARNGQALAQVADHSCQGCHVRLRPQLVAEIKSGREIFRCENCSRILYILT